MDKRQLVAGALGASLLAAMLPSLAVAQDEAETFAAEDIQWLLASYVDGEAMADVPEGVEVSLLLNAGEATGSAGCNTYAGNYEIDATTLSFPDPLLTTLMVCEGPEQATEDAYMPLLQTTAGWSMDGEGMLSLSDVDGAVTLVYGEAPVTVTGTDVAALAAELESLQAQIDTATAEVAALSEAADSLNVSKLNKRLKAAEDDIKALQTKTEGLNVSNLKNRIKANEIAIADLEKQMSNVKKRVKALEETDKDHETRIKALEEPAPEPTQLPE